ncbi:hypothetical protein PanWU01x14_293530, partial [Parasponia andersonii]
VTVIEVYLCANQVFVDYRSCMNSDLFSPSCLVIMLLESPYDRVPLKDMMMDWHACLDYLVGYKLCRESTFFS